MDRAPLQAFLDVDVSRISKKDVRAVIDEAVEAGKPVGVKRATRYLAACSAGP